MTQRQRRRIKVERRYRVRLRQLHVVSKIRLEGDWLTQVFEPGSYVVITPSMQRGRRVLVLCEAK